MFIFPVIFLSICYFPSTSLRAGVSVCRALG